MDNVFNVVGVLSYTCLFRMYLLILVLTGDALRAKHGSRVHSIELIA